MNFKHLISTFMLLALAACSSSNGGEGTDKANPQISSKVDVAKLHKISQQKIGVESNGVTDTQSINVHRSASVSTTAEQVYKIVDLAEEYRLMAPVEYKREFTNLFKEMKKWKGFDFGTRYLERTLTSFDISGGHFCTYESINEFTVVNPNEDDFHVIQDTTVGEIYTQTNDEACQLTGTNLRLIEYWEPPFSMNDLERSFNKMRKAQVYFVKKNTFIINDENGIAVVAFNDDHRIHIDAIFTDKDGRHYNSTHIPLNNYDSDELRLKYQGQDMELFKQVYCDTQKATDPNLDRICIDGKIDEKITFVLDKYLQ